MRLGHAAGAGVGADAAAAAAAAAATFAQPDATLVVQRPCREKQLQSAGATKTARWTLVHPPSHHPLRLLPVLLWPPQTWVQVAIRGWPWLVPRATRCASNKAEVPAWWQAQRSGQHSQGVSICAQHRVVG